MFILRQTRLKIQQFSILKKFKYLTFRFYLSKYTKLVVKLLFSILIK
jgi:hypothetical protein